MLIENIILFIKKNKRFLYLCISICICMGAISFFKDYSPSITNIVIIITTFLSSALFFYLWTIPYNELPMLFICLNYLIALLLPAMLPAIVIASIFDFSLEHFMFVFDVLIIIILTFHMIVLMKFLKDKDNVFKQRILERIKVASGISIPFLGLVIVMRITYPQMGNLLNVLLVALAILNIYRGLIDLMLYKVKFPNDFS